MSATACICGGKVPIIVQVRIMSRHRRRIARSLRALASSIPLFAAPGAAQAHATWDDGIDHPGLGDEGVLWAERTRTT